MSGGTRGIWGRRDGKTQGTHRRGGCRQELVGGSIVKLGIARGPHPCDEL